MRTAFPRGAIGLLIAAVLTSCSSVPQAASDVRPSQEPMVPAGHKAGSCVIEPHTHCADLTLAGKNFAGGALRNADFHGADLTGSDLRSADLRYADLSGAILVGASLVGAQLAHADLSGADFDEADLAEASLIKAVVDEETSFTGSFRCRTITPEGTTDNAGCPSGGAVESAP